jgi:hypothetical protein
MVPSVTMPTIQSAGSMGAACGPSNESRPAIPPDRPIMKMTSPETSGGKTAHSRLRSGASTSSSTPAKS